VGCTGHSPNDKTRNGIRMTCNPKRDTYEFVEPTEIPRYGFDAPRALTVVDLVPAHHELIAAFRRRHDNIYSNQGVQKVSSTGCATTSSMLGFPTHACALP
jgi:hypothetical protein